MSTVQSDDGSVPAYLGPAAGLASLFVFGVVGALVHGSLLVGVVAGAFAGGGSYFVVPYRLRRESGSEGDDDEVGWSSGAESEWSSDDDGWSTPDNQVRRFHPGAAGYGLSTGGIVAIAAPFVVDSAPVAVGAAVALALAAYSVLSKVLPR